MTTSERDMLRPLLDTTDPQPERFTSLQPTYEDTVPPDTRDWYDDDQTS